MRLISVYDEPLRDAAKFPQAVACGKYVGDGAARLPLPP